MEFKLNEMHRNVSEEELLEDVKRVAAQVNSEAITVETYRKYGKYNYSTLRRKFGNWSNILLKATLIPTKKSLSYSNLEKQDLLIDVIDVFKQYGFVTRELYDKHGKYGTKTLIKFFGNWENVLSECNIPLNCGSKYITDTCLLQEIETVWIRLGRQPTTTDIKNGESKFSLNTYCRRFGSWRKALEFFIEYISNDNLDNESADLEACTSPSKARHTTKRDINLRLRFLVMKRDNFKCCICGRSPATTQGIELHIDHVKPWAKGGETVLENLQTLCSDCNLGKSDIE